MKMHKSTYYPVVYEVEDFAEIFKLRPAAVRSLIRHGEIPAIRIGKQYRIPQFIVDQYFASATTPTQRGFGMWEKKAVPGVSHVNKMRDKDRRSAADFLEELRNPEEE